MRPFAFGMTAYLVTYHLLYVVTRGQFQSPDTVSDMYFFVLATYAGAPEVKRWKLGQSEDPEGWNERLRKGGPLITLWFLLWAGVVLWRLKDPSVPMPPELKSITLQVIGLFFGAYAIRQVRKRSVTGAGSAQAQAEESNETVQKILQVFASVGGQATPRTVRDATGLPRSTVSRVLSHLVSAGRLERHSTSAQDPNPAYRLKPN